MSTPRLIRTAYTGRYGDRISASVTLEGAVRAAVMRILSDEYDAARVYDNRFGELDNSHALTIYMRTGIVHHSIVVRWTNPALFPRNPYDAHPATARSQPQRARAH